MAKSNGLIIAPERTFVRARRCANCRNYDTNTISHTRWQEHRAARISDYLATAPVHRLADLENPKWSPAEMKDARLQQLHQMDRMIALGTAGVCVKGARPTKDGGPEGDFVTADYLCDRWDGIDGHSVATAGHSDKLGDELHDIADGRAKKV